MEVYFLVQKGEQGFFLVSNFSAKSSRDGSPGNNHIGGTRRGLDGSAVYGNLSRSFWWIYKDRFGGRSGFYWDGLKRREKMK
jgi:hypothetical protein